MKCPQCGHEIDAAAELGRLGGIQRTEAQTAARRANGKKGGRPKGSKNKSATVEDRANTKAARIIAAHYGLLDLPTRAEVMAEIAALQARAEEGRLGVSQERLAYDLGIIPCG